MLHGVVMYGVVHPRCDRCIVLCIQYYPSLLLHLLLAVDMGSSNAHSNHMVQYASLHGVTSAAGHVQVGYLHRFLSIRTQPVLQTLHLQQISQ